MKSILLLIIFAFFSCAEDEARVLEPAQLKEFLVKKIKSGKHADRKTSIDSLYKLIQKHSDNCSIENLFLIADGYYTINERKSYYDVSEHARKISTLQRDSSALAKAYLYKGDYFLLEQTSDSAYANFYAGKKLYEIFNDELQVADILKKMSGLRATENDLEIAELYAQNALKIYIKHKDYGKQAALYNILGFISTDLGIYDDAEIVFNKSIDLLTTKDVSSNPFQKENVEFNLACLYFVQSRYLEADTVFNKILKLPDIKTDLYLYSATLANAARNYYKLHGTNEKIAAMYDEAIILHDSLNFITHSIINRNNYAEYCLNVGDTAKSRALAREAFDLSSKHKDRSLHVLSLQQLINSDPENAAQYSKQYVALNDSIQIAERKIINKFARIEFETDQLRKERDDAVTTNDLFYQILIIFFILFLSYFYFIYRKFGLGEIALRVIRKKYELELFEQASTQQQDIMVGRIIEKTRISRDLHDGVLNDLALIRNRVLMVLDNKSSNLEGKWTACKKFISRLQIVEKEIHAISHGLNTNPILKGIKFRKLVDELFRVEVEKGELKWRFEHDKSIKWKTKEKELKLDIYRTLQEVIKNINKHSNASSVLVRIKGEDNAIIITAADNGDGFKDDVAKANGGVANIRARVAKHGGQFDIQSDAGKGVKIFLVFSF